MATGRGLRGWTRQARAASGELWAGIERLARRKGHGLRRRTDERAGTSKAGQTDGRADGLADGPN